MNDVATKETHRLISSDKVDGTAVYNRQGDKLGTIQNIMISKVEGRAEYAVLSFGGFLGLGDDHYPIPWDMLTYDENQGGYVVDLNKEQLRDAPRYGRDQRPEYDPAYSSNVNAYYGMTL